MVCRARVKNRRNIEGGGGGGWGVGGAYLTGKIHRGDKSFLLTVLVSYFTVYNITITLFLLGWLPVQLPFTCLKLTIETLAQGVKYVLSKQC